MCRHKKLSHIQGGWGLEIARKELSMVHVCGIDDNTSDKGALLQLLNLRNSMSHHALHAFPGRNTKESEKG